MGRSRKFLEFTIRTSLRKNRTPFYPLDAWKGIALLATKGLRRGPQLVLGRGALELRYKLLP